MTKVSPFLTFSGNCTQAIEMYEKAFKAQIEYKATYSQANKNEYNNTNEAQKDWIYHAQLKIGKQTIMMCDDDDSDLNVGDGKEQRKSEVCLCVEFSAKEELMYAYDVMKEDAIILEPMSSASYSEAFVLLEDKFGIRWWLMMAH